jgi:hypothetical protein
VTGRARVTRLAALASLAVLSRLSVGYAQPSTPAASPSDSADVQMATNAFWEGKRLYDSGQFEQALNQFETAYRLVADPTLLYNIAQTHRQMGNCRHAKDVYAQFRARSPDSPLVAETEGHLAALEKACPTNSPPAEARNAANAAQSSEPRDAPAIARTPERQGIVTVPEKPEPQGAATPRSTTEKSRRSGRLLPAQQPVVEQTRLYLTLTALAAGLVAGGIAVGFGFWNRDRHEHWEMQDASLAKGKRADESDLVWSIRQQQNDELSHSIARTGQVVGYLSAASGALLIGSALLFFTAPQSTAAPMNVRRTGSGTWCIPAVTGLNDYHLLMQTAF